jgi:hypothetical protein
LIPNRSFGIYIIESSVRVIAGSSGGRTAVRFCRKKAKIRDPTKTVADNNILNRKIVLGIQLNKFKNIKKSAAIQQKLFYARWSHGLKPPDFLNGTFNR